MAKSRAKTSSKRRKGGGGVWLGLLIGLGIAAGGYFLYTHSEPIRQFFAHGEISSPPEKAAKTAAKALPAAPPPNRAIRKLTAAMAKAGKDAPFGPSEDVFEAGAHVYAQQCASCHGTPKRDSPTGQSMHPASTQYWNARHDDPLTHMTAHEVYEAIAEGNMTNGMPAYGDQLSDTQIWQLTLLLRSSRLEMPMPVLHILDSNGGK